MGALRSAATRSTTALTRPPQRGARPGNPAQRLEKVEFAPGSPVAALAERGDAAATASTMRRAASARKIRRKALKRLNPRPGLRRALLPRSIAGRETGVLTDALPSPATRSTTASTRPPQAARARKIPVKALKKLIRTPGLAPPRVNYGVSQLPRSAERNSASITRMLSDGVLDREFERRLAAARRGRRRRPAGRTGRRPGTPRPAPRRQRGRRPN